MTTLTIIILCILVAVILLLAWLIAGVGKVADDTMDEIINRDRHRYKDAERESK